jgi:NAD(P)-dependent dehydrogenase (short-subunit alcohol dehydrogenase family)
MTDRIAIVAGAATGIGRATALRLAAEGATLVVGSPEGERTKIDTLVAEIEGAGGRAIGCAFDATDDKSVASLIDAAVDAFGGFDVVHANFADLRVIFQDSNAAEVSDEVLERTLDVNLKGMLRATRAAIPLLLARGGGAMIYTSSTAARIGEPERPCYAMAKAGVNALVRHVASRWGKQNIRANAVMPGFVLVPEKPIPEEFSKYALAETRSPRLGKAEDIAAMVALLASDDGAWVNGQSIAVDGGSSLS